jgi:hypothetical protein
MNENENVPRDIIDLLSVAETAFRGGFKPPVWWRDAALRFINGEPRQVCNWYENGAMCNGLPMPGTGRCERHTHEPRAERFEAFYRPRDNTRGVVDEGTNDAKLIVVGEFDDDDDHRKYCEQIAAMLNGSALPPGNDEAVALLQEIEQYLCRSDFESIHTCSVLHRKIQQVLASPRRARLEERITTALCHLDIEIPDVQQAKAVLRSALTKISEQP